MHSLSASGLYIRHSSCSRPHFKAGPQSQKCKVAFSGELGCNSSDALLLAQSLTAKSREFVSQHQDSGRQQRSGSNGGNGSAGSTAWAQGVWAAPAAGPAASSATKQQHAAVYLGHPWQQQRQQQQQQALQRRTSSIHVAAKGLGSSSSSSSGADNAGEGWLRTLWPLNGPSRSGGGSSRSAGTSHQVAVAAAAAAPAAATACVDAPAALMSAQSGGSSSSSSVLLLQKQQQQAAGGGTTRQHFSSSNGSGWSYYCSSSSSSRSGYQARHISSQSWLKVSDTSSSSSSSSSMAGTASLDSMESVMGSVEDAGTAVALSSSSSSRSSRQPAGKHVTSHRPDVTNSRLPAGAEDADWLTAVLSASTSKLSVHSNAVLTNSLKRLASLRPTNGSSGAAAAAAAAAAAVEGPEGLVGLLESVRARFSSFGLQHFEEVALQLGQLGYEPEDEWLASFERHSMAAMPGGSPRLLSRLLAARARLPGPCSAGWAEACLAALAAQPGRLTVSGWVNALGALLRLRHKPGRTFQAAFFSATAARLADLSPELLASLTWSLSRLQLQPSFIWWRALVNATAGICSACSHGQLASLIHSVALWAEPGGVHMRDVQRLVDLLLAEVECQLAVMQPGELTTILWSLGSLNFSGKYVPDCEVQDALLDAIQGQLPRLNPGQLASLCWGLAKLQHPLPEGFAEALLLEVQAQVQGFSDAGLTNVMWALARLGLQPGAAFKQPLWEELHARCGSLTLQDLSTLMWALARLSLQPPADLLSELTQHSLTLLSEVHGSLHAQDLPPSSHRENAELAETLANLLCALGRLQASPGAAWLDEVDALSLLLLPRAGLPQLLCIAKGLQQLRQRPLSHAWQAACLREVRLRCRGSGVELDCASLAQVLAEVGVVGLADGAAAAEQSFRDEEEALNGYCAVEFQSGCR